MFASYVKLALRNLYRNKLYALINIFGLSVAIACCIAAYVNYEFSQSYDAFHSKRDRIYAVHTYKMLNKQHQEWATVPIPVAPLLASDVTGIERACRMVITRGVMRRGEHVFNETFHYADPGFFEMFSFKLLQGEPGFLQDKRSLALTEEIATKYFGQSDPIGEQVVLTTTGEEQLSFVVAAVISDPPANSTLHFDIVVPFDAYVDIYDVAPQDWSHFARTSYLELAPGADLSAIETQLATYLAPTNEHNPDWKVAGFFLEPMSNWAFVAQELRGDPYYSMHPAAIIGPSVTALLVLLLACFNYVNTAIAFASRRLKEIGIRKVVGGMRGQLIVQYLSENLVLCLIALLLGLGLAHIFVPAYNALWPYIDLKLTYSDNVQLFSFLIVLLIFTAVAAGAYPAFYVSHFRPVTIFRGQLKLGGTNPLIRVLLTFQFALSIAAMVCGIVFSQNAEFIREADLGFERNQNLVVPVQSAQDYRVLKQALASHPDILNVGASRNLIGRSWHSVEIESEQQESQVQLFQIGERYLETFGHTVLQGRALDWNLQSDLDAAILVNEKLVEEFGWDSAPGKYVKLRFEEQEKEYRIVGVVRNFHAQGVWGPVEPAVMRLCQPEQYRYVSIRIAEDKLGATASHIQAEWKRLFPHRPYDGFFVDELLAEAMRVNESIRQVFVYIAIISVLIAAMGLFALVSLNIARRTKEIGIRKVLGASLARIGQLISREFMLLLTAACVLAIPMGYYLVNPLISSIFTYHVGFGAFPFALSFALMFVVALLTVGMHVYQAATANPAQALRDE